MQDCKATLDKLNTPFDYKQVLLEVALLFERNEPTQEMLTEVSNKFSLGDHTTSMSVLNGIRYKIIESLESKLQACQKELKVYASIDWEEILSVHYKGKKASFRDYVKVIANRANRLPESLSGMYLNFIAPILVERGMPSYNLEALNYYPPQGQFTSAVHFTHVYCNCFKKGCKQFNQVYY